MSSSNMLKPKMNTKISLRPDGPRIIGVIELRILNSGAVEVHGPIKDPSVVYGAFVQALMAVGEMYGKNLSKNNIVEPPSIIVPTMAGIEASKG